jgi:hypothetical protein
MFGANRAPNLQRYQHYLEMNQNEIPHDRVPSGASKMISKAMVRSAQTMYVSCFKISTIYEPTESSFHSSLVT